MKYLIVLMAIAMICLSVVTASTLPEHPECAKICQNANRGCTYNCTKSGGSDEVCGSLCADRYSGCFWKCLYDRKFNCSKK